MANRRSAAAGATGVPRPAVTTAALLVLLALLVTGQSAYRAATQSITHDEACTYNWYLARPANYFNYDPNNHPLFTCLAMASLAALGTSELTLRLPTVAAAAVFAAAVVLLLGRAMPGPGWLVVAAVTTLANPLVLDYLSAARGYGLALALLFAALAAGVRLATMSAARPQRRDLLVIGLSLGLCVAASLAFLFAAAAATLAVAAMILTRSGDRAERWDAARSLAVWLAVPGMAVVFLFYLPFAVKVGLGRVLARSPGLMEALLRSGLGVAAPATVGAGPALSPGLVLAATAALICAALAVGWGLALATRSIRRSRPGTAGRRAAVALAALTVLAVAGALAPAAARLLPHLAGGYFYTGSRELRESANTMIAASFLRRLPSSQEKLFDDTVSDAAGQAVISGLVALAPLAVAAALARQWRRRIASSGSLPQTAAGSAALLLGSVLALAALAHLGAYVLLGVNLPPPRAAVFVPPLLTVTGALALAAMRRSRAVAAVALLAALALLGRYAHEYDPRVFWGNLADAGSREVFSRLKDAAAGRPPGSVRVGGDWIYEPSMNFYRQVREAAWMQPYVRDGAADPAAYEFLVLTAQRREEVHGLGFEELYREPLGGTTLLRRAAAAGATR